MDKNSLASVEVFSRIFRKLWSTVKVCEGIFPRFGSMIALRVYIMQKTVFPKSFLVQSVEGKRAREYPMWLFRAETGALSRASALMPHFLDKIQTAFYCIRRLYNAF